MEKQTVVRKNRRWLVNFFFMRVSRSTISVTALMVLLAGLWAARQSGESMDHQMRQNLVREINDVAAGINIANIRELSFTAADKDRPVFQRLCAQLRTYAEVSGPDHFYIMALRDGQIVFGPESLPEGAAASGTVYPLSSGPDFEVFRSGRPQFLGPFRSEYGTFVTALAPVSDPYTGEVLAAVGVDVEASVWEAAVRRAQWTPVRVAVALLVVLLLSDMILEYFYRHPARRHRIKHIETFLCAVFMILLTLVLAGYFDQIERAARRNTFDSLAHLEAGTDASKIYDLRGMMSGLQYYFESSTQVSREGFGLYCNAMPGKRMLEAFIWMPAVPDKEVNSFIETVRAEGVPDFSIWQRNNAGLSEPAALRPVYFPALYVKSSSGCPSALTGYDLNSEPQYRAAIQEALNTGLTCASDPVQFIAATNSLPGFFIFQAVNAGIQRGVVAVAICPERLITTVTQKNKELNICLFQLRQGQKPLFMAGSGSGCGLACWDAKDAGLCVTVPIFRFGKTYVVRVLPSPDWLAQHPLRDGRIALGVGLLLTLLVCSLTALITNRRIGFEEKIERRTAELKRAEENLAHLNKQNELILTSVAEGILGLDLKGDHTFVNPAAAKMLGYEVAELLGRSSRGLWYHAEKDGIPCRMEDGGIYSACKDGKVHHASDAVFWRKDGTGVSVEYDSRPIYECGQVTGAVVTFTDITERKKYEAEVRKSLSLLEATLDATADGILVVDGKGKILRFNRRFIEMWRIPGEIAASGSDEVALNFVLGQLCDPKQFLAKVQALYRSPEEKSFDVLNFHDGRVFERYSQPQKISEGVIGRVWSFHDVTKREQAEALLWASQTKLDLALQSASMGVWQWDVITDKRTYDRQTCAFLGINPATFSGTEAELLAVVHPDDRQKIKTALARTVEQHAPYDMEHRVVRPDGSIRHIAARAHLFLDDGDQQLKVTGVCWDITDRKRAEEELRDAKAVLQAAMDQSPAGIVVADAPDGRLRYVNSAALLIRGSTCEEVVDGVGLDQYVATWQMFDLNGAPLSPDEVPLTRAIKYGETNHREFIIRRTDHDDRIVFANAAPIIDSHGEVAAAIVVFLDITERRRAEERMHLLAQHLQTVREEERKRISRELHDDIGQILTAIKIDLAGVEAGCRCEGDTKNKMADIQQLLIEGIQSVHTLCRQLRPGALDDLSLLDALEGLVEDWKNRNRVECDLFADVDDEALSDEVRTVVFRMVQEALTNVSRYAKASKVEINLVADGQTINVTITDNGCGMEPGAADKPTSFGLLGMRERVETLGGTLCIESAPGQGTRIEGTISLTRNG